jgi:hypothetical protein
MKNLIVLTLLMVITSCQNQSVGPGSESVNKSSCKNSGCSAVLAWEANPPEDKVSGYVVEYGLTSSSDPQFTGYEHVVPVNNQTRLKLTNLENKKYYVSIRPVSGNIQGELSGEIVMDPIKMRND